MPPAKLSSRRPRRNGLLALTPLLLFALLFVGTSLAAADFYAIPMSVVFIVTTAYALAITRGVATDKRLAVFTRGASDANIMTMVWIFVMAGAFSASAQDMGAIDATVAMTRDLLPSNFLLAGLFLASCFVSISIGTSVGTVVTLVPIAAGLAPALGADLALTVAVVTGGAFFGDNLSFISDTTVVATRTQGCRLDDKFKANFRIVLPAALLTLAIYAYAGFQSQAPAQAIPDYDLLKVVPYVAVLVMALCGMNVLFVLAIGNLLTGLVGLLATDGFSVVTWFASMGKGITSMGELIIISMIAGGLLELIRYNGGITYMMRAITRHVNGKRGAEFSIAALVGLANLCTANNTVAILSVGKLAKHIAERYGVDKRKSASVLDTVSCCVQGVLPYGAQLLMAAGLSGLSPVGIVPYLYYPMLVGLCTIASIAFRYPRKYS